MPALTLIAGMARRPRAAAVALGGGALGSPHRAGVGRRGHQHRRQRHQDHPPPAHAHTPSSARAPRGPQATPPCGFSQRSSTNPREDSGHRRSLAHRTSATRVARSRSPAASSPGHPCTTRTHGSGRDDAPQRAPSRAPAMAATVSVSSPACTAAANEEASGEESAPGQDPPAGRWRTTPPAGRGRRSRWARTPRARAGPRPPPRPPTGRAARRAARRPGPPGPASAPR